MIVSAIADPAIFGPVSVTDELASREVLGLLRGILQNGVLLCDPSRQMLRDAMAEADTLSKQPGGTQRGQRISLILQEIHKQHKKYVVSCEEAKWNATNPTTVTEQIVVLHAHLQADVVIAPITMHATLTRDLKSKPVEIVAPQDISVSRYESLRTRIAAPDKPLDEMRPSEIEELVGRAVKYCCVLRMYDYRMVARARSIAKYRDGIQFVLAIWAKWCVVGGASRTVELYTVGNTQTQDGFLTGEDAKTRLDQDIVAAVKANGRCHSTGHVMDDSMRIFHARGFEAKRRAFTIDPGFDALGSSGPIRRCLLKADVATEKHFEQCRGLRSV
jgi:hypothetical protein